MAARTTVNMWEHWSTPNGHVLVDDQGEPIGWKDHPGCHYCDVLAGRFAQLANRTIGTTA